MISDFLIKHTNNHPNKIALITQDKTLTYYELLNQVNAIAFCLQKQGVKKGTAVAVILKNSIEFSVVMLAIARIGAMIVPLNTSLKDDGISKAIQASDASHAVVGKHHLETILKNNISKDHCICIEENIDDILTYENALQNNLEKSKELIIEDQTGEEPFILTMTSGSTSDPKPIIFSQNTKIKRAQLAQECYNLDEGIISIAATPQYHSLAQRLTLLPLFLGGTAVIMKNFTPKLWLEMVEKYHVTISIPVSSQLSSILNEYKSGNYNVSSLKTLVSSSALISQDLKEELIKTFNCEIHEIYGTSEVATVTNLSPKDGKAKLGTVGKALPGVRIKIIGEKDEELPTGEAGEIIVQSPTVFSGYHNKPEITKESMRGGYFHTGDIGKMDQDGFLTFVGRKKDIIITGGINVYPQDIEKILMNGNLLKECAVIGLEDSYFGEAILAVVVPKNKDLFNIRELQKACIKSLADYQQPLAYEIVEELPKNNMGKIMKPMLREQFKNLDLSKHIRGILSVKK
jgi:long-chain acyl-CoA synthetase